MELKHPNDQAVAQRLQRFKEGLRKGWYDLGAVEQVLEHIKQLDDEAEARWRAVLKQDAEAKQRAEKEALFGHWSVPGAVVCCPDPRYHITITPPSQPPPVMTSYERLSMALQLLREVMLAIEYLPSGVRGNAEIAHSLVAKAKKLLRGDGNV